MKQSDLDAAMDRLDVAEDEVCKHALAKHAAEEAEQEAADRFEHIKHILAADVGVGVGALEEEWLYRREARAAIAKREALRI